MPYYRCAECDLTVYATGGGYSAKRACPDCGAELSTATPVLVGSAAPLPAQATEPEDGVRQGVTAAALDRVAAIELVHRWVNAVNRGDVAALIKMADDAIAVHPTRLVGDGRTYSGHDGVREWIAALTATSAALARELTHVRHIAPDQLLATGGVSIGGKPKSPFSILISLRDGKVAETHAYLSDEADLKYLGRLPD